MHPTAVIWYIEELMKRRPQSAGPSPPLLDVQEPPFLQPLPVSFPAAAVRGSQGDEISISSGMSSPAQPELQGETGASYSRWQPGHPPGRLPIIGNSSCMFPFPAVSSSPYVPLPPPPPSSSSSSSLLSSPAELPSHYSPPSFPAGSTERPLTMSPPFHCGPDGSP